MVSIEKLKIQFYQTNLWCFQDQDALDFMICPPFLEGQTAFWLLISSITGLFFKTL